MSQPRAVELRAVPLASIAASHAALAAARAVDVLQEAVGITGLRDENRFQHYFRDVHTILHLHEVGHSWAELACSHCSNATEVGT